MPTAIQTAVAGLHSAADRLDGTAQRIASPAGGAGGAGASGAAGGADRGPATQVDLSDAVFELIAAKTDFAMNVAVLRTADAMQKRLLDVIA